MKYINLPIHIAYIFGENLRFSHSNFVIMVVGLLAGLATLLTYKISCLSLFLLDSGLKQTSKQDGGVPYSSIVR